MGIIMPIVGRIFYWPLKMLVLNYHYYSILVLRWQNTVSKFHIQYSYAYFADFHWPLSIHMLYWLQYMIISFALAKHRLRVSQTVLLCPLGIAYLCLFYPATIGCTSILHSMSTAIWLCSFFAILTPLEGSFVNLSHTDSRRWCVCCFRFYHAQQSYKFRNICIFSPPAAVNNYDN